MSRVATPTMEAIEAEIDATLAREAQDPHGDAEHPEPPC